MSKTITVSDGTYKELIKISKELNKQSHRCTRMPYVIQIRDFEQISAGEGHEDGNVFIDARDDHEEVEADTYRKLIKHLKYIELYDELEVQIKDIIKNNKFLGKDFGDRYNLEEIQDLLIADHGFIRWGYQNKAKYSNAFFTDKGAKQYLKSNSYHFTKKADTYLTHLDRNPEMELMMSFLCELTGGKLHT